AAVARDRVENVRRRSIGRRARLGTNRREQPTGSGHDRQDEPQADGGDDHDRHPPPQRGLAHPSRLPRRRLLSRLARKRRSAHGHGALAIPTSSRQVKKCPEWDSNPHWIGFEPNASAGWAIGASETNDTRFGGHPDRF